MSATSGASFDVYARPFVPKWLRDINEAKHIEIYKAVMPAGSAVNLDYAGYVTSVIGGLLPRSPPTRTSDLIDRNYSGSTDTIQETVNSVFNYGYINGKLIESELEAVKEVQRDFTIYQSTLTFIRMISIKDKICIGSFRVPGVAEHSPFIRIGDVVQLRQVLVANNGSPYMWEDIVVNGSYSRKMYPCPGWNGVVFDAVVTSVNLATEDVSLCIRGPIVPTKPVDPLPQFNIMFPARKDWIAALRESLHTVDSNLQAKASLVNDKDALQDITSRTWTLKMLFPIPSDGADQTKLNTGLPKLNLHDSKLNYEQVKAVDSILKHNYGTVPYLISGPPGTGKTKTIVETALQLCKNAKVHSHILMCAPSDPAADTLVLRLREHFKPGELLRLNEPSRTFAEVNQELMLYTYIENNHHFSIPPFKELMHARIVVVACRDADMLVKARVTNEDLYNLEANLHSTVFPYDDDFRPQKLHWTALLMDEAGQATEPESLLPLTVVMPPKKASHLKPPQLIMAGDHKQLGPRTASRSKGMDTSLFERLLERPCYRHHPLARHRVGRKTTTNILTKAMLPIKRPAFTNLIRNYRSHPSILAVPNHEFYYESLLAEAPDTDLLLALPIWKGRKWPVLLSCNPGADEHETDGGGWYNMSEIKIARQYALEILKSGLIHPKDICIMSPFQSQVRRLRRDFRNNRMGGVNIGPMEAFQGLESRFVVLCTTRSRDRFLDQDIARGFGIIHEPKRFNVALTRAKQGLIVIGNPSLLSKDLLWKRFMEFCNRNGLVDGKVDAQIDDIIDERVEIPALERIMVAAEDRPRDRQLGEVLAFDDEMQVAGEREEEPGEEDEEIEEDELEGEDEDNENSGEDVNTPTIDDGASEPDSELAARLSNAVAKLVEDEDS